MIRVLLDWTANIYIVVLIVRWGVETFFHQQHHAQGGL